MSPVVVVEDPPEERRSLQDLERLAQPRFPVGLSALLFAEALIVAFVAYALNRLFPFWGAVVPLVAWALVTSLVLVPATMRRLSGYRRPTEDERAALGKPWREVLQDAGLHPRAFHLVVTDSEELNSCAPVWRFVAVTSHSAGSLPADRLAGVLAHELGHVLGWRMLPAFVHAQLTLPSRALLWTARLPWTPVAPMWKRAVAWHRPIGFLLVFLLAFAAGVATLILAIPTGAAYAAALLARFAAGRSEAGADAVAARLGRGAGLLAALDGRVEQAEHELPLPLVHRARKLRRLV
ncbi:M48 family metalloprotease [Actinomadura roseirufa]|uniref:M48 family metalloprotease n=1 Tax=Actinomadura roseirufa TaxID=2094049 RepID=UPI0013F17D59|nr:M48 family metalloprotease [Actinomadura roseirufa]